MQLVMGAAICKAPGTIILTAVYQFRMSIVRRWNKQAHANKENSVDLRILYRRNYASVAFTEGPHAQLPFHLHFSPLKMIDEDYVEIEISSTV